MGFSAFRRHYFDVVLAVSLIGAGTLGLYVAHNEGMFESGARDSLFISVGSLIDHTGGVRYRFGDSMIWKEAKASEQVSFGDAIFTATDGRAKVQFKSGREATILPNSMVVIHEAGQIKTGVTTSAPMIEIKKGKIALKREIGKSVQPFFVKAGDKVYRIEAQDSQAKIPNPQNAPSEVTESSPGPSLAQSPHLPSLPSDDLVVSLASEVDHADTLNGASPPPSQALQPLLHIESSTPMKITEVVPASATEATGLSNRDQPSHDQRKLERSLAAESAPTQEPSSLISPAAPLTIDDSGSGKIKTVKEKSEPKIDSASSKSSAFSPGSISNQEITPPPDSSRQTSQPSVNKNEFSAPALSTAANDLILKLRVSEGPTLLIFHQSGAFGAGSGSALSMASLQIAAEMDYDLWRFAVEFQNYSLDFGTSTVDPSQSQSKNLQTVSMKAGYGVFLVGVQAKTVPVFLASGSNTLNWSDLTTIAPIAGIHLEKQWIGPSQKRFLFFTDLTASKPISGSGETGGVQVSDLSGFGGALDVGAKKTVFDSNSCKIRLGLDVGAVYSHFNYTGSFGTTQGEVTQSFQEYSTKLGVEFEF